MCEIVVRGIGSVGLAGGQFDNRHVVEDGNHRHEFLCLGAVREGIGVEDAFVLEIDGEEHGIEVGKNVFVGRKGEFVHRHGGCGCFAGFVGRRVAGRCQKQCPQCCRTDGY